MNTTSTQNIVDLVKFATIEDVNAARKQRVQLFEKAALKALVEHNKLDWDTHISRGSRTPAGYQKWYCRAGSPIGDRSPQAFRFNGFMLWVDYLIIWQDVKLAKDLIKAIEEITGKKLQCGDNRTKHLLQQVGVI